MAQIKVPYLTHRTRKDGGVLFYWQPNKALRDLGFTLQRLPDDPAEAIAAAQAINQQVRDRRSGATPAPVTASGIRLSSSRTDRDVHPASVEAMVRAFKKKDEYLSLAEKTRVEYDRAMLALSRWAGDMPKAAINADMARKWIRQLAITDDAGRPLATPRPAHAKSVGRVVRRIFYLDKGSAARTKSAAEEAANPFARIGLQHVRANIKDPEQLLWCDAAVAAFAAAADELDLHSVGTAIMVNYWLGQRLGDVLDWPLDFADEIRAQQSKRGRRVILPVGIIPHVMARIEAERDRLKDRIATTERVRAELNATGRNALPGMVDGRRFVPTLPSTRLLVSEATGLPYGEDHFGKKFDLVRAAVAKAHPDQPAWGKLTFQRTRHSVVTRMAEAGCTDEEIATITGHSLQTVKAILEFYLVRTRKLGAGAIAKRLAAERQEG